MPHEGHARCWYVTITADIRVDANWHVRQLNTPVRTAVGQTGAPSAESRIAERASVKSPEPGVAPVLTPFVVHRMAGLGEVSFR